MAPRLSGVESVFPQKPAFLQPLGDDAADEFGAGGARRFGFGGDRGVEGLDDLRSKHRIDLNATADRRTPTPIFI